jgi:hypothetical protein
LGFPAVFAYYKTDWDKDGLPLAWKHVTKLASDTNNLVERFNFALKYIFTQSAVQG